VAVALSLLLHAAVLWLWVPRVADQFSARAERGKASGALAVRLAPPPSPATSAPPAPSASPAPPPPPPPPRSAKRTPPPPSAPRPPPTPPVIAKKGPAPAVATPPVPPSATAPPLTPVEGDFSANLEARRRARGASAEASTSSTAPVEDERARHSRIVAENLGLNRTPTYGQERKGGGIFQIEHLGYTSAEFTFFGWNKDIRRRAKQLIEVQKGANSDIRIAVVRRMIAIIRDHESEDFVWVSPRLGREVTLSARLSDNGGLEAFLMQEFFSDSR
jgi:outer membrane biosynthesis protein TonB